VKKQAKPKPKRIIRPRLLPPPEVMKLRPGQAIPARASHSVEIVKNCVKFYEETTGAKANQTRLIDFVRWCEENHGLL